MDSSVSVTIAALTYCFVRVTMHVIIRRKRTLKKEDQVSKQVATLSQKKEYEEILLQNHPRVIL